MADGYAPRIVAVQAVGSETFVQWAVPLRHCFMRIEDDCVGFDVAALQRAGATFTVESAPGERVVCVILLLK